MGIVVLGLLFCRTKNFFAQRLPLQLFRFYLYICIFNVSKCVTDSHGRLERENKEDMYQQVF